MRFRNKDVHMVIAFWVERLSLRGRLWDVSLNLLPRSVTVALPQSPDAS